MHGGPPWALWAVLAGVGALLCLGAAVHSTVSSSKEPCRKTIRLGIVSLVSYTAFMVMAAAGLISTMMR